MNVETGMARIEILQVPECPLVGQVRDTVRRALEQCRVRAEVEERVGDYPSPTLLVDGRDVTGRELSDCGACRLDLPSEEQVLAALCRPDQDVNGEGSSP